jgi:serine protease AprX
MVKYRGLLLWFWMAGTLSGVAQTNRYFISFKDKTGTPYSVNAPQTFLSTRSIERRLRQGIAITEEDLPVNPDYVRQVKAAGAQPFYTSRWWNGVLVEMDVSKIAAINALPAVKQVTLVAPGKKLSNGRHASLRKKKNTSADAPVNQTQLKQIGLDVMHEQQLRGEGIRIAVFDSGFQGVNTTSPFAKLITDGRIGQVFNFVNNSTSVYQTDDHGTEVLSVMAACYEGVYTGGAYNAEFFLYLTEDVSSEYRIEEYNWMFAAERADSAGVDIINSSLGYNEFDDPAMDYTPSQLDGKTAIVTQAARKAIEKGMLVVCSAGNEGGNSWRLVTPPADAEKVLAVGSVNALNIRSPFSSRGPTADGRIKPDVVAMGSGTSLIRNTGSTGTGSGTSLASPLVASLAAGVWQAFPNLRVDEIYEAITASADQALQPDNLKGFGLPHFVATKNYIESKTNQELVSVYPNPAYGDQIFFRLKSIEITPAHFEIFDIQGKRVAEFDQPMNWLSNPFEYNLSNLLAGIYLIRIKTTEQITLVKLIRM